jgi:predicted Zn-dependent protease
LKSPRQCGREEIFPLTVLLADHGLIFFIKLFVFMNRCLVSILVLWTTAAAFTGCTIKHPPVPAGVIPSYLEPTPGERGFGKQLFEALDEDYETVEAHPGYELLRKTLHRLLLAIGAKPAQWQLFLFDKDELIDVRAVEGNYIFVWSGFLDFVRNADEIAAVLACEIAHVLADHTNPVEFTILSKVLFRTAEVATSVGLVILSQGTVAIGGQGWMEYVYVEAADLDPLDREYDAKQEKEAMAIAGLIVERTGYDPKALLTFWRRVKDAQGVTERKIRLNRSVSLEKRLALLNELMPDSRPEEQIKPHKDQRDLAIQDSLASDKIDLPAEHCGHR